MVSNMKKWVGVAALFLLITCLVVGLVIMFSVSPREDATTAMIRTAMKMSGVTVNSKNRALAEQYASNPEGLLRNAFPKWDRDSSVLGDLSLFAINLMEFVVANGAEEVPAYLKIVRVVVQAIKNELEKKPFTKTSIPWGKNWFPFSVHVTRLFAMFEYFGEDQALGYQCHLQLVRMIPTVGVSLRPAHAPHKELNLFYMMVSRLCSNYRWDPVQYDADVKTKAFQDLKDYLQMRPKPAIGVSEGVFEDDSCIYSDNVASYGLLRHYDDFHDRVYRAFGFTTGFQDAASRIFPKILHPTIPFVPLGLFGRTGSLTNQRNYSVKLLDTGIFIAPFIGFGVFKTPKMLFYVRVQRPGIAAYQIKKDEGSKDLAQGWVQMRKIWQKNDSQIPIFKKEMTWNELKDMPGLLTFKDQVRPEGFVEDEYEDLTSFMPEAVNSFIGQVNANQVDMDKKLLFWKNSYKLPQAYKDQEVRITEAAVVTVKGLQAHYTVQNNSGKELRFNYRDPHHFKKASVDGNSTLPFHTVGTGLASFDWKMLTDEVDYKVEVDAAGVMKFEFLGKKYSATVEEDNESFKLSCDGKSETFYAKSK